MVAMFAAKGGRAEGIYSAADDFSDLDSLEFIELLQEVEQRWGVQIPDGALGEIATVGDLVRYVEARRC